jgi:hypothetical protein
MGSNVTSPRPMASGLLVIPRVSNTSWNYFGKRQTPSFDKHLNQIHRYAQNKYAPIVFLNSDEF